jgi:hypothetical protein
MKKKIFGMAALGLVLSMGLTSVASAKDGWSIDALTGDPVHTDPIVPNAPTHPCVITWGQDAGGIFVVGIVMDYPADVPCPPLVILH